MNQLQKDCDIVIKKSSADSWFVISWITALVDVYNSKKVERSQLASIIDAVYIGNVHDPNRIRIIYKVGYLKQTELESPLAA